MTNKRILLLMGILKMCSPVESAMTEVVCGDEVIGGPRTGEDARVSPYGGRGGRGRHGRVLRFDTTMNRSGEVVGGSGEVVGGSGDRVDEHDGVRDGRGGRVDRHDVDEESEVENLSSTYEVWYEDTNPTVQRKVLLKLESVRNQLQQFMYEQWKEIIGQPACTISRLLVSMAEYLIPDSCKSQDALKPLTAEQLQQIDVDPQELIDLFTKVCTLTGMDYQLFMINVLHTRTAKSHTSEDTSASKTSEDTRTWIDSFAEGLQSSTSSIASATTVVKDGIKYVHDCIGSKYTQYDVNLLVHYLNIVYPIKKL